MNDTTTLPYDWLKEVPTALLQLDDIPLLGFPPVFPWDEFNQKLKESFQTEELEVKPLELKWRSRDDLFEGLGQDLIPIHFQIPSLEGDLTAIFAKRDINLMMSLLLAKQKEPLDIIDEEFQDGFIHFLAYEMIYIFNQCNFDKSLNPHVAEKKENHAEEIKEMLLKRESTLCQDISLQIDGSNFILRLCLSNEFRKSWKEKYAARTLDVPLQSNLAKKIHIPVALEAGKVSLSLSEWKKISVGDFLLLDACSLDPTNDKGRVMLTVNGNRFFRARFKDGTLKILEHPLFFEGKLTEQMTLQDMENNKETKNMAKDIPNEDEDLDDDFTFDETKEETEGDSDNSQLEADEALPSEDATASTESGTSNTLKTNSAAPKFIADEMMLDIIVEVGRLEMSIQKLTDLQPGNVLEIDVRPENGVDLVVNGKRIGKGELLKIGEVLGVRILDI